jgi:lipoprotein-releasing system ATP-binding protein
VGRDEPILRATNVHRYLGEGDTATHILRGVDLTIGRGEYVSIIGASGSGKSTMLYLLGGLDRPSTKTPGGDVIDPPSRIAIDGIETTGLSDVPLAKLRSERLGFVFQFHYLLKEFTAQENVALPALKLGRMSRGQAMDRSASLLDRLGLGSKVRRRANRLSGGEQQRVAIARALVNEPAVLLADEPTGNLDRANTSRVADVFDELSDGGQAIVIVTHELSLAKRAKRIITMEDGRVVKDERSH